MFGTIPGDIIELNRFFIILVTIATELQGLERCLVANFIRNDMVQGSGLRVWSMLETKRTGTGEKAGGTLGMHIGTRLESTIQPGNQSNLVLQTLQRTHGGS